MNGYAPYISGEKYFFERYLMNTEQMKSLKAYYVRAAARREHIIARRAERLEQEEGNQ